MRILAMDMLGTSVMVILALAPGLAASVRLGRGRDWGIPGTAAVAFALSAALATILAFAGRLVGIGIGPIAVFYALASAGSCFWLWRSRGQVARGPSHWAGAAVGIVTFLVAFWERPWFQHTPDTFYHLAAVRSLLVRGETLVTDPFHGTVTSALDPTSGTWHAALAMDSWLSGIDVAHLFVGATALGAAMIALGFWALCRRLSGSTAAATIATVAYMALAHFGDFRMAGYPHTLALAFVFACLLLASETADEPRWELIVATAVSGLPAVAVHLGTSALLVALLGACAVWLALGAVRHADTRRERLLSTRAVAAAMVLMILIAAPYFIGRSAGATAAGLADGSGIPKGDIYLFLTETVVVYEPGSLGQGGPIAWTAVLVLGVLAVVAAWRRGDRRDVLVAAIVTLPVLLLQNPLVTPTLLALSRYATNRIGLLFAFTPFLAVAWAIARGRRVAHAAVVVAGIAMTAFAVVMAPAIGSVFWETDEGGRLGSSYTVGESRSTDVRSSWGQVAFDQVEGEIGTEYPVVAATTETGYYLAGLMPVAVVAAPPSHSPFMIETVEGPDRRSDMEALFAPEATEDERREILQAWDAEYVALWLARDADIFALPGMLDQEGLFEQVVESRRLVLLRVLP